MVVIKTKLHLIRPCINPNPANKCVIADRKENASEKMPSSDKMRNNVTSILKVSKTHFKLQTFDTADAEFKANMVQ